ncbi:hypothetical protein EYC80_002014 [Monilinia laxa]|uniref:Uncharacterized protein n=1 Tax=Monilinia laxa TaxID=61186 RepID=A0A5N6K6U2_MONLA|nr:hypothetical protein EYC80_002014 [Monilinia laxa]
MSNQRPKRPSLIRNDFSAHNAADLKVSPHKSSELFGFQLVPSSTASAPNGEAVVGNQNERWFSAAAPGNGVISDAASDAASDIAWYAASDAASDAPIHVYNDSEECAAYLDEPRAPSAASEAAAEAEAASKKRLVGCFIALGLETPDLRNSKTAPDGITARQHNIAEISRCIKGKGRAIDKPIPPMKAGDSDGKEPNEAFKALEAAGAAIAQFGSCNSSHMTSLVDRNTCKTTIAGPSGTNGRE